VAPPCDLLNSHQMGSRNAHPNYKKIRQHEYTQQYERYPSKRTLELSYSDRWAVVQIMLQYLTEVKFNVQFASDRFPIYWYGNRKNTNRNAEKKTGGKRNEDRNTENLKKNEDRNNYARKTKNHRNGNYNRGRENENEQQDINMNADLYDDPLNPHPNRTGSFSNNIQSQNMDNSHQNNADSNNAVDFNPNKFTLFEDRQEANESEPDYHSDEMLISEPDNQDDEGDNQNNQNNHHYHLKKPKNIINKKNHNVLEKKDQGKHQGLSALFHADENHNDSDGEDNDPSFDNSSWTDEDFWEELPTNPFSDENTYIEETGRSHPGGCQWKNGYGNKDLRGNKDLLNQRFSHHPPPKIKRKFDLMDACPHIQGVRDLYKEGE
jgi:hypothetical protein